jgi:hypothetical protein
MAQAEMARITCSQCDALYNSERELHDHKKTAHREFGSEQGSSHTELSKSEHSFSKRGKEKAVEVAVEEIKKLHKDVKGDMIAQVGTISANTDKQVGSIIAEAMKKVGKDGVITVEKSKTMETTLEVVGHTAAMPCADSGGMY